jgi:DUF4097 and DUF4098 domain-containing protein YvlB
MQSQRRAIALLLAPVFAITLATVPAQAEVREEFHKTVAMDANGSFSLKNVNGGVTITAWDKNEVEIDAMKTGRSEEKLGEARIEVEGSGHSVDVRTKYPDHTNNSASVEYTIHLPKGARLYAVETVNGAIHIDGARGPIKAETVNGKVEVWNAADEISLKSVNGEVKASLASARHGWVKLNVVNGSVSLSIPSSTNAHIKASTVNGGIQTEFPLTVNKPRFGPGAHIDTTLGSGGANIEL